MSDPVAFGTARLDEDAAAALEACDGASGTWLRDRWKIYRAEDAEQVEDAADGGRGLVAQVYSGPQSAHVARHDPARVLREVTAHRALLAMHGPTRPYGKSGFTYPAAAKFCGYCGPGDNWQAEQEPDSWSHALWPCRPVRLLIAIWSDHPDYDQEWKP